MKKKFFKILSLILIFTFTLSVPFSTAKASDTDSTEAPDSVTYEYFDDGSYIMTTITILPSTARTTNYVTATKTGAYLNADNELLWSVTVTGSFKYTGTTSTCTDASVSTTFKSSAWKLVSSSASKSGNTATATADGKYYFVGLPVATRSITVTLTCDKNGNLT